MNTTSKKINRKTPWLLLCYCTLILLALQGCFGIGDTNSPFQSKNIGKNGNQQIGVNTQQAHIQGKIYFTLDRNLYQLDSKLELKQLTHDMDVRDPAVSPDGKWIAFIERYKYYSDLVYISTNPQDQTIHTVVKGNGGYYPNQQGGANNYYWFAQPSWSADSTHLLFLSDLQKDYYWASLGGVYQNAYFLDMQVFSLPIDVSLTAKQALQQAKAVGYAIFGDGGDRDPSYRPNHPEQIMYTSFRYDPNGTKQIVTIALEDTTLLARGYYHPTFDPSVDLTPATPDTVNFQPTFSSDGNHILYVRREDATHMSLYVMPVAEGVVSIPNDATRNSDANTKAALAPYNQSFKLLTQQYVSQPVWSPDGKQILYYGFANNTFDIWMATLKTDPKTGQMSLKPGSQVQLTAAQGHLDGDSRASWSGQ